MTNRWRYGAAVAAVCAMVLVPASLSAAQEGPSSACTGDLATSWPDVGFGNGWKAAVFANPSNPARPGTRTVATVVPAGTYTVDTEAYDGYTLRSANTTQELEQYFLQFIGADGSVLATTGLTQDLPNGTEGEWFGSVGQVTLAADAVAVRAVHRFANEDRGNQSVMPSCFSVTSVTATTTTTTTTTTTPTSSTVVEPPSTTVIEPPASSSTTVPSGSSTTTTTAAPTSTTSTVPTQVLPEVQEMPDPTPVAANPTFTG